MEIARLPQRAFARRVGLVLVGLMTLAALRSAAPAPELAAGVTDPGTGELIGELTYGITPARLLDTRPASTVDHHFENTGKLTSGSVLELTVRGRGGIPSTATGVFINVTVSDTGAAGYLSVWPEGDWPGTSTVNFARQQTVANFAFVAIGSDGRIRVRVTDADAQVIVDAVAFTSDLPTI